MTYYGQINYKQKLGTGPKAVSIAAAGCFVTADANLLKRFGDGNTDPATLNQWFIDHGTYIVEADGTKDLLSWGAITAYNPNVRAVAIGDGSPTDDNSIVKFVYDGGKTHFCLVASAGMGTIVDSWDGVIKSWNAYGGPVAYATYSHAAPQPATTAKAQARYTVVENYPNGKQVKLNKQPTQLWGMNYAFAYMVDHPVETHNQGEVWTVTNKVHHEDGYDYYRREGQVDGFNVLDCDDYTPPAPLVIPPLPPKVYTSNEVGGILFSSIDNAPKPMYINRVGGAEKWSFKDVGNWRDFKSVQHFEYGAQVFIVGQAKHPIPPTGATYLMIDDDFGNFRNTGDVVNQYGFGVADLSETRPPALPVNTPAPIVPDSPQDWHDTYKPFAKAVHYVATRDTMVHDLDARQPDLPLPRYKPGSADKLGMVAAYGTVTKDGVEYYRLKIATDATFKLWYCIPKLDSVTRTPNLLVAPGETAVPISKATVVKDAVVLAKSRIEFDMPKFLDDIIPKFLKKQK